MISFSEHPTDGEAQNSGSCSGANVDLLLFSDDEEDYDDDRSFFEIAIHHTQHRLQKRDDNDDGEGEIELRISFSLPISGCDNAIKSQGRRDFLIIATHGNDGDSARHQSPFSSSSSSLFSSSSAAEAASPDICDQTTAVGVRVTSTTDPLSSEHKLTHLCSNWELTPACCKDRKSSEQKTSPNNKASGILNFLIKFPAARKFQKLLASFAKATANTPSDQDIATTIDIASKTTSSQTSRRRLHKFLKKSLNKWLVPIRNELGLKNMKSYCSFEDDHYEMDHMIVITSNEKKPMIKAKRRGVSNPSSIRSSPAHQAPMIDGRRDDHHQSSIQAAIAHCRRSSTPDFCFSTSYCPS